MLPVYEVHKTISARTSVFRIGKYGNRFWD